MISSLGPLLWLADVWLEMCLCSDRFSIRAPYHGDWLDVWLGLKTVRASQASAGACLMVCLCSVVLTFPLGPLLWLADVRLEMC
jgi:hypothetical protein